jgi:Domain of unknown function (DUF4129)
VQQAIEAVYQEPDLHGLQADRVLRFKRDDEERAPRDDDSMRWLRDFVAWFSEAGRWLIWFGLAVLLILVLLRLRRWFGVAGDAASGRALALPSHVRDLDIRPESLPDDLPAAVRALWARGETRAALSLLYRGALSRLVHEHAVPVRAASTEGECVDLAARHLARDGGAFFARLVALWQAAVYGARAPDGAAVFALCDGFDAALPRRAPGGAATR